MSQLESWLYFSCWLSRKLISKKYYAISYSQKILIVNAIFHMSNVWNIWLMENKNWYIVINNSELKCITLLHKLVSYLIFCFPSTLNASLNTQKFLVFLLIEKINDFSVLTTFLHIVFYQNNHITTQWYKNKVYFAFWCKHVLLS